MEKRILGVIIFGSISVGFILFIGGVLSLTTRITGFWEGIVQIFLGVILAIGALSMGLPKYKKYKKI
ncbi:MAG: hypothetical protein L6275_00525 [Candidatus Portnoybacteria bacterium]|nr:hypothetical protein [Candidatus Portnoybacteria bacterium]